MSLVNINGDDHVFLAAPFLDQVKVLDSDERGQLQGYNRLLFPLVSSFQVAGFSPVFWDGARPNRLAGILKLSAFITDGGDAECPECPDGPVRPASGIVFP